MLHDFLAEIGDVYKDFDPTPYEPDTQGWHGTNPIFRSLIEELKPQVVIEVGSWKGQSACTMGKALKRYGGRLICVDTWLGSPEFWTSSHVDRWCLDHLYRKNGWPQIYYTFLANMVRAGLTETVTPFAQTSDIAAKVLAYYGVEADLIYIDASHERGDVYRDITAYWPLLKDRATMFGDDLDKQAVFLDADEFAKEHGCKLETRMPFWAMKK